MMFTSSGSAVHLVSQPCQCHFSSRQAESSALSARCGSVCSQRGHFRLSGCEFGLRVMNLSHFCIHLCLSFPSSWAEQENLHARYFLIPNNVLGWRVCKPAGSRLVKAGRACHLRSPPSWMTYNYISHLLVGQVSYASMFHRLVGICYQQVKVRLGFVVAIRKR